MRLLFIRHGQTDGNVADTVYGQTDLPLNKTGQNESCETRKLVETVAPNGIDAVYASDLTRAKQTATLVCPDHSIQTDARFREFDFGEATGQNLSDYLEANPDVATVPTDPFPGGESAAEMFARVAAGLLSIAGTHDEDDAIVVVMHSGPFDCLYHFIEDYELVGDSPDVKTGEVVEVAFDGTDFTIVEHHHGE